MIRTPSSRRKKTTLEQCLVVLPPPVIQAAVKDPLLEALRVTDAGFFPRMKGHHVMRPLGTSTTLLIVCTGGQGWFAPGKETPRPVTPGQLVWLPAGQPHAYGAHDTHPWTIAWVHCEGREVESWRKHLQIPTTGGCRHLSDQTCATVTQNLEEIYHHLNRGYTRVQLVLATSLLRVALAEAAAINPASDSGASAEKRVAATIDWMRHHWERPIQLAELAALARVSVPHYTALFRRITGYSPVNYLIRQRIQHACRLLDTTDLPMSGIAQAVGMEDPFYFSRIFSRIMGRSPRDYRRAQKG